MTIIIITIIIHGYVGTCNASRMQWRAAYVFGRQRAQKATRKATHEQGGGAVLVFATRGREQRIVNVIVSTKRAQE